ncbi:MAG: NADH-quinone oxidoreductase subunit C [Rickettsiales bacterium]
MLKNINEHITNEVASLVGRNEAKFVVNKSMLEVHIAPEKLMQVLRFLCGDDKLCFIQLVDLFGLDYPARSKRFEVVYNLLSTKFNYRVCIKVKVSEEDKIPSVHEIYPNAIWFQREVYDMYGVEFSNSPDSRRILTDYGFEGHPLRKDFPLSGYKEVRYDIEKRKVVYEPVNLVQEYRHFDFISPWEGTDYKLPGDEKAEEQK